MPVGRTRRGGDEVRALTVAALIGILLLMAIWRLAIVAIDHWVWAGRSDLPPAGSSKLR